MAMTGTKLLVVEHFKLKMTTELKADLIPTTNVLCSFHRYCFIVKGGYFENNYNNFLRASRLSFFIASVPELYYLTT